MGERKGCICRKCGAPDDWADVELFAQAVVKERDALAKEVERLTVHIETMERLLVNIHADREQRTLAAVVKWLEGYEDHGFADRPTIGELTASLERGEWKEQQGG